MLRKLLVMLLVFGIAVAVAGCSSEETPDTGGTAQVTESSESTEPAAPETEPEVQEPVLLTADDVVKAFQDAGLPVGSVVVYTAETDPNSLLGRPGQYTGKANWADTRIEQLDPADPTGGTVEVFATEEELAARREYIESVTADTPMLQQYIYQAGNALVRLEYDLTPDQASEYEQVLLSLAK